MSKKKQYQNGGKFTPKNAVKKTVMSEKKKNLLAYILAFFMVVWTVCSVLGTIGFVKSSAEEENITIPRNYVRSDNSYGIMLDGLNQMYWYGASVTDLKMNGTTFFLEMDNEGEYFRLNGLNISFDTLINYPVYQVNSNLIVYFYDEVIDEPFRITINTLNASMFTGVPVAVEYEKRSDYAINAYIMYENGEYISIAVTALSSNFYASSTVFGVYGVAPVDTYIVHQDITYYTLDEAGGYTAGYDEGYSVGRADGYGAGYTDGVNEANDYTFFSLISSVIDVPVQTFINLLNFDLLGVNMADFGLSLLTVCIIIAVIKLFI